jgi:hypothetical protein
MYSCSLARSTPGASIQASGIIVSSHLIRTHCRRSRGQPAGQHVELGMRDIFRGKLCVFLRWRRGVTGTDNKIGRNRHLPKPLQA